MSKTRELFVAVACPPCPQVHLGAPADWEGGAETSRLRQGQEVLLVLPDAADSLTRCDDGATVSGGHAALSRILHERPHERPICAREPKASLGCADPVTLLNKDMVSNT